MKDFFYGITQYFSQDLILQTKRMTKFIIIYSIVFIIIGMGIKYAIPFVIALLIAMSLQGIKSKLKSLNRKFTDGFISMILTLTIVTLAGIIIFVVGYKLATQLTTFYAYITDNSTINNIMNTATNEINLLFKDIDPFILEKINELIPKLIGLVTSVVTVFVQNLLKILVSIPTAFIMVIITIIATYFFTKDIEVIKVKLKKALSQKGIEVVRRVRRKKNEIFGGYLKAFGIIMIVVIIYSSIVFKFCGIPYAIIIGIFTGVFDALPIFGAGLIYGLVAISSLLQQDYKSVFVIAIGYIGCVVIRQFLQQQLMSTFLDLHPLVIIIALFLIVTPVGFIGMFYFLGAFLLYDIISPNKST